MKVGDVVVLKSGGPKMTVCGVKADYFASIFCQWFDSKLQLQSGNFVPEQLIVQDVQEGDF